jgi:hypothetical protein
MRAGRLAQAFFDAVLAQAEEKELLSSDHFTVDGTLIEAWASHKKRKRVEEVFGWMKTVGLMRKTRHRGRPKVGWTFTFTAAAYDLVRMRN